MDRGVQSYFLKLPCPSARKKLTLFLHRRLGFKAVLIGGTKNTQLSKFNGCPI